MPVFRPRQRNPPWIVFLGSDFSPASEFYERNNLVGC